MRLFYCFQCHTFQLGYNHNKETQDKKSRVVFPEKYNIYGTYIGENTKGSFINDVTHREGEG